MPDWRKHEAEVNQALGLDGTIASGNQFHDIGDGVHRGHSRKFPMIVDCKATDHESYTLKYKELTNWWERAKERGRVFGLPTRFDSFDGHNDYITLELNDFCQILAAAEEDQVEVRPARTQDQKEALHVLYDLASKIRVTPVRARVLEALQILEEAVPE